MVNNISTGELLLIFFVGFSSLSPNVAFAGDSCKYEIVESMPDQLTFNRNMSFNPTVTHEALIDMLDNAKKSVKIASFYMMLTSEPKFAKHPSTLPGRRILNSIIEAKKRGLEVQVILDSSGHPMSNPEDVSQLKSSGVVVKYINMKKLLKGGVMHTKFMITDGKTLYVGSSNFDWRSYSQIKEIGIKFNDCETLASDLDKIFEIYSLMSDADRVPNKLPDHVKTKINMESPFAIVMNKPANIFLGSSPPDFNGKTEWTGRTSDIHGLLSTIDAARHKIDISVMNYGPRTAFIWPKEFKPEIEDALKRAASTRGVSVRLLFSNWTSTKPEEIMWYKSLDAIQSEALHGGGIKVKLFQVPAFDDFQKEIPFARVKHDKYMVTDAGVYIGTSNWTPDYFITTCGVSYVIWPQVENEKISIIDELQGLFDRDWNSQYAHKLA